MPECLRKTTVKNPIFWHIWYLLLPLCRYIKKSGGKQHESHTASAVEEQLPLSRQRGGSRGKTFRRLLRPHLHSGIRGGILPAQIFRYHLHYKRIRNLQGPPVPEFRLPGGRPGPPACRHPVLHVQALSGGRLAGIFRSSAAKPFRRSAGGRHSEQRFDFFIARLFWARRKLIRTLCSA